jgi:hypothetical protein
MCSLNVLICLNYEYSGTTGVAERGATWIRTCIDAHILIAAATGRSALYDRAWAMLDDLERLFLTSAFVRLEVMPKAVYVQHQDEHDVYVNFFTNLAEFVPCSDTLLTQAHREAESAG